jgi:hypothetical protein
MFYRIIPESIIFQSQADQPNLPEKRKALSAAFFKSKLVRMTDIIKRVTISEIRKI